MTYTQKIQRQLTYLLRREVNTRRAIPPAQVTESSSGTAEVRTLESKRPWLRATIWAAIGTSAFQIAYSWTAAAPIVLVYLFALTRLAFSNTWRQAFYPGLVVGLGLSVVQLRFFWTIFSAGAPVLWIVYSIWLAVFVLLLRACFRQFPRGAACLLLPFLWVGLEYFRSELYYLRFSWVTPVLAFFQSPDVIAIHHLGIYGASFVLATIVAASIALKGRLGVAFLSVAVVFMCLLNWRLQKNPSIGTRISRSVQVAGIQMEFPTEKEVLLRLTELITKRPETELIVLSEYTFNGPLPSEIKAWCKKHQRHLIVGATDPVPGGNYYNTAFVIDPEGEVIFRQVKAVPIQFFKDGLPAPEQKVWASPWGRIGICICYDLSYTRVTDPLIKAGAEALIVPTMDVIDWGRGQHELHSRIAPVRAAEHGVPIFRLASSGISQAVDASGHELRRAPSPGDGAVLTQVIEFAGPGRVPPDRILAMICVASVVLVGCGLTVGKLAEKLRRVTLFSKRDMTADRQLC